MVRPMPKPVRELSLRDQAAMRHDLCPVMLFSGKGGVGKTTLAAATAVRLARAGSRVLIVSTDPAHSLSDVFDYGLGPEPRRVMPNLDAMEIDARGMFAAAIPGDAAEGDDEGGSGTMARLMRMASQTPGVDEFGAIEVLLSAVEQAQHDVVILDTAPTGHTLRLLMLPELLDGWLGTLLSLRSQIARAGRLLRRFLPGGAKDDAAKLEEGLLASRERMTGLRELLTDPDRAQIFLVTIPEAMGVLETLRTLELLNKQGLPVGSIMVNQMQPKSDSCVHCQRRRAIHERELAELRVRVGNVPVKVIEALSVEVRGCNELEQLSERVWGDAARAEGATDEAANQVVDETSAAVSGGADV